MQRTRRDGGDDGVNDRTGPVPGPGPGAGSIGAGDGSARSLFAPEEQVTTTRDRLVVAALELFYEEGFHAVGIDRVVAEVGVTRQTFYNHFESRDDLVLAALARRDRWESEAFVRTAAGFADGTPRGDVLAVFDALDHWFRDTAYRGCLFLTAAAEFPALHDPVHRAAAEHHRRQQAVLVERCRRAAVPEAEELARRLALLLEGAVATRMVHGDDDAARRARTIAERLLDDAGLPGAG